MKSVLVKSASQGLGTSGAVGVSLGCVLLLILIFINILCIRRHKKRQNTRNNTSSATLAGDASTISYTEGSVGSRLYDPHSEHIYETLMEPFTPSAMQHPPPYSPHDLLSLDPPSSGPLSYLQRQEPPPVPPNHPSLLPPEEPPPPYDACKDTLVLSPAQYRLASQWLQPSTSV